MLTEECVVFQERKFQYQQHRYSIPNRVATAAPSDDSCPLQLCSLPPLHQLLLPLMPLSLSLSTLLTAFPPCLFLYISPESPTMGVHEDVVRPHGKSRKISHN